MPSIAVSSAPAMADDHRTAAVAWLGGEHGGRQLSEPMQAMLIAGFDGELPVWTSDPMTVCGVCVYVACHCPAHPCSFGLGGDGEWMAGRRGALARCRRRGVG